jgi:hypothetical protein
VPTLLEWQLYESHFAGQAYDGRGGPLLCTEAPHPLCLTALHSVNHYRGTGDKPADLMTGSLALILAQELECNLAVHTHKSPSMNSAWGTPPLEAWLQGRLEQNPQLKIIDLHGAKDTDEFDVAMGTGGALNPTQTQMMEALRAGLESHRLKVALNPKNYAALSPRSLTYRLRQQQPNLGILQLEITRRWRMPETDLERANQMVEALTAAFKSLTS